MYSPSVEAEEVKGKRICTNNSRDIGEEILFVNAQYYIPAHTSSSTRRRARAVSFDKIPRSRLACVEFGHAFLCV